MRAAHCCRLASSHPWGLKHTGRPTSTIVTSSSFNSGSTKDLSLVILLPELSARTSRKHSSGFFAAIESVRPSVNKRRAPSGWIKAVRDSNFVSARIPSGPIGPRSYGYQRLWWIPGELRIELRLWTNRWRFGRPARIGFLAMPTTPW